jgi:ABC-type glycerol-3-phosphate transport system substrate-binding protein
MKKAIALAMSLLLAMSVFGGAALASQTDLNGVEVTFWYMPLYEGFDELMSEKLAAEVKDAYGIILNTEVLTWDAGPEKVTVAMATTPPPTSTWTPIPASPRR